MRIRVGKAGLTAIFKKVEQRIPAVGTALRHRVERSSWRYSASGCGAELRRVAQRGRESQTKCDPTVEKHFQAQRVYSFCLRSLLGE